VNAEAVRFGAVSALGMAVCCTLTSLVAAGTLSVAVGWMSGSIGLAVVTALLICALVVARKRNPVRACNDCERSEVTTDRAAS
jgi:hypothetical protein